MSDRTVSVVIPFSPDYTPREMLEGAVSSAEAQSVDTDIVVVEDPDQRGPSWARNRGIERSSHRYVAFLDADDLWNDGKLARQLREMRDTGAGICVEWDGRSSTEFLRRLLFGSITELTSSVVIDTEQVETRFEESLRNWEDYLFILEVASYFGVCFCEDLVTIRRHDEGLSASFDLNEEYERKMRYLDMVSRRVPELRECLDEYRVRIVELRMFGLHLLRGNYRSALVHLVRAFRVAGFRFAFQQFYVETTRFLASQVVDAEPRVAPDG